MKKKHIETKTLQRWKKIDSLSFIIPALLIFIYFLPDLLDEKPTSIEAFMLMIIIYFILCGIISVPIWAIWKGISRPMKIASLKRTTFKAIADIEYYRDKLVGLSPVDISMLTDLDIQPRKDITGLLLKYQLDGYIDLQGHEVKILNKGDRRLKPSEQFLLDEIVKYGLSIFQHPESINEWKKRARKETTGKGWFMNRRIRHTEMTEFMGCASGCLLPLTGLLIFGYCIMCWGPTKNFYEYMDSYEGSSIFAFIQGTIDDRQLFMGMWLFLPVFLIGVISLFWPVSYVIQGYVMGKKEAPIVRTTEGERLTEYIFGMKNFLRDFSMLSQADKEYLALWDDFLIYAVVLEENEQIVQDLFKYRDYDLTKFLDLVKAESQ